MKKSFVYKKWDGTQHPFDSREKEIVDAFMENILKGLSPETSMAGMFWDGFTLAGMDFRVMGLEEMLGELQEAQAQLFNRYSLDKIFDRPLEDIRTLLERENSLREEEEMEALPSYGELPRGLLEKIRSLAQVSFIDEESEALFESWRSRQQEIVDLYEFYGAWASKFTGDESLDFDQAVELMRRMEELTRLQRKLQMGRIGEIDQKDILNLLGEHAGRSFNILLQLPRIVNDAGIATLDHKGLRVTPRGMRRLGEMAFGGLYRHIKRDGAGDHRGNAPPGGEIEPDTSRPYQYGDRFDLDITKTVIEAVTHRRGGRDGVTLAPQDFYVRERETQVVCTTVVLLDLSWSMAWGGRFEAAKKVALALDHYIRTRFPNDRLHIIGFSTLARELRGRDLALAVWDSERPFTNLQDGLRLAMKVIKKSGARNNRVIVITDGQPTAYFRGPHLHVELPNDSLGISPSACKATLTEIRKVTAQGMHIDTFMLDTNPALVEFTRELSRLNGGKAVICRPDTLGELILVEEIRRRRGRI